MTKKIVNSTKNSIIKIVKTTLRAILKIFKWAAIGNFVLVTPTFNILGFIGDLPFYLESSDKKNFVWENMNNIYESFDPLNKLFTLIYRVFFKMIFLPYRLAMGANLALVSHNLRMIGGLSFLFILIAGYIAVFKLMKYLIIDGIPSAVGYLASKGFRVGRKINRKINKTSKDLIAKSFDAIDRKLK